MLGRSRWPHAGVGDVRPLPAFDGDVEFPRRELFDLSGGEADGLADALAELSKAAEKTGA